MFVFIYFIQLCNFLKNQFSRFEDENFLCPTICNNFKEIYVQLLIIKCYTYLILKLKKESELSHAIFRMRVAIIMCRKCFAINNIKRTSTCSLYLLNISLLIFLHTCVNNFRRVFSH